MPFKRGDIVCYKNKAQVTPMDGAIGILGERYEGDVAESWNVAVVSCPQELPQSWLEWLKNPFWDEDNLIKLTETLDD